MTRDAASQRQIDAADPNTSTWLLANAGSGKTRVLTDRVARLLLENVSPQNILCLTYTKAAASEMQNRLFSRLGNWAMMPDVLLRQDLLTLGIDDAVSDSQLKEARTLFARAIETPGGLKIQTIHSFCAGLLRRFPLEAKVSPQFREMEERDADALRQDVMDQLIDGPTSQIVRDMLDHFTGDDIDKFTAEIASKSDYFVSGFSERTTRKVLNLSDHDCHDTALNLAFAGHEREISQTLIELFADQSKTYQTFADRIGQLDFKSPNRSDLDVLFDLFLYKGTADSKSVNFPQSNHTKAVEAMAPIADQIHDWMDRVAQARQLLWSLNALNRTRAVYAFAEEFLTAYEAQKTRLGALDFDDLIRKAKALLIDPNVAQWVLFRLDGGIDHILVDEAQDTSPTQWAVIKELTQEFATGEGAQPDRNRTIFVVGDKKQSIYSFQGADPVAFDQMRAHFQKTSLDAERPFEVTSLDHSFRSAQSILSVVDATFQDPEDTANQDQPSHVAFKSQMPGRVDLWPVIESTKKDDDRLWYKPVDEPSATDHNVLMAQRVAEQIKHMIANERIPVEIGKTGMYESRPISEGDFLILVQRRSDLFAEIIRACKAANLQTAGADRLRVGAELAVKDIAALLSFLALPEDDLSFAAALRSPLFDWSEQDLFTLAHHRPAKSYLWAALRASKHHKTLEILNDLRKQAEFLRPYELIERILVRHNGRSKLLARLGPEAEDGIDALLAQSLDFEKTKIPSLTSFLAWMQTDDLEIKRQMDNQSDRVRVMTVHGAKGLEAPIVILPDSGKRDVKINDQLLQGGDQLIWKTPASESSDAVINLRNQIITKQEEERKRLLYVAMTRAEKWLIVGAAGDVGQETASWYNMVAEGMKARGAFNVEVGDMSIDRVADMNWDHLNKADQLDIEHPAFSPVALKPVPYIERTHTISPSELPGPKVISGNSEAEQRDIALEQGTLLHLLLEHLPSAKPDNRLAIGKQLTGQEQQMLIEKAIALINQEELADIWSADALTEVEITAEMPGMGRMHGTIDRLIVTQDRVTAIDFKSNQLVPSHWEKTPTGIINQLAAYHAGLTQIYPDREIQISVLWTQNSTLMVYPNKRLHEALNVLASS